MISIVIPTYNRSKTIVRSVQSILDQSITDFEIIIVDDGSTDGTPDVVAQIADARISVIKLDNNHGAAHARNIGIRAAAGEYVALHDSDDSWRPLKLEKQIRAMNDSAADICLCRLERNNYPKGESRVVPSHDIEAGFIPYDTILQGGIVAMPAVLAKREVFESELFNDAIRRCEDYEWTIRVGSAYNFFLVDDILGDVYLQDDSVTLNNKQYMRSFYETVLKDNRAICDEHPAFHAQMISGLADCCSLAGEKCRPYYLQSFKLDSKPKYLIKYLLSSVNLLNPILRRR